MCHFHWASFCTVFFIPICYFCAIFFNILFHNIKMCKESTKKEAKATKKLPLEGVCQSVIEVQNGDKSLG